MNKVKTIFARDGHEKERERQELLRIDEESQGDSLALPPVPDVVLPLIPEPSEPAPPIPELPEPEQNDVLRVSEHDGKPKVLKNQ